MAKTVKNLLANGKNNITTRANNRANMLGNVQSRVANNTSATNLNAISTPTRPDLTRPITNPNLQKAQQPIQTKLDNLNNQTLPIQNNTGVGNVAPTGNLQATQPEQSRFIGFQQPVEQLGKSFQKLNSGGYTYIPTDTEMARRNNTKEEAVYNKKAAALDDLQHDIYNLKRILTESEIKSNYPEFKDNVDEVMKLQKEVKPILAKGNMVTTEWLEQKYSELLSKDIKDLEKVEEDSKKLNETYQAMKSTVDRVLNGNWEALSADGLKKLRDMNTLVESTEYAKENKVVGEANDYEIMAYLIDNNPELQKVFKEMGSLQFSKNDEAILGTKDASKLNKMRYSDIDYVTKTVSNLLGKEQTKATSDQIETAIRGKEALAEDYWGETGRNIKVKANAAGNTIEKFIYKGDKDLDYYATRLENYVGEQLESITKPAIEALIGQKLTDEEYEELKRRKKEAEQQTRKQDKQKVLDYMDIVNKDYEEEKAANLNPDVENYVNNRSMTRMLLQGDIKPFVYKSSGEAAENVDNLVIMGMGVAAPEIVLPIMFADSYARESQESFEELMEVQKKMGIPQDEAYDNATKGSVYVGLASSLVEVGLEKVLGGVETTASKAFHDLLMKDFTEKATKMIAEKGLMELLKQGAVTQFKASLEEGLEEVFQQAIHNKSLQKYDSDQKITEGMLEAFEGGFYNWMNLLAGGGDVMSNVQQNSANIQQSLGESAYNAGVTTRNILDSVKNTFTRNNNQTNRQNVIENINNKVTANQTTENTTEDRGTTLKEGGLGERVLEELNGLDENTRERIKKNPYSVEESKNLIKEMGDNPGIDFGDYQNGRYEEVLDNILDVLDKKENKRRNDIGSLYDKIESANKEVDVTELKNKIAEFQAEAEALEDIATTAEQAQIKTILENIQKIGDGTMDVWKVRKMADKRGKRTASSTYDGIGLIWDIRDAIDDVIIKQNPDMKEVDASYRKVLKEISEIKGKLYYKNGGLKSNAVSTVKNMLNAGNRLDLNNLEKYIPGIKQQLEAIRDSKFVYNAYTTGKGSRFISGIARGVFGNIGKALGFLGFGWGGLIGGAVLDAGIDKAMVNLTRKALKETITKETEKSKAELERINKKIAEGKQLDAQDKARLKELGKKIEKRAEESKKTKAEQEAWDKYFENIKNQQALPESIKLTKVTEINKPTTPKKPKNKVTKKSNKKSDSNSDIDTTPTDTTPPSNPPTTPPSGGDNTAKNKVTKKTPKKKSETKTEVKEAPKTETKQEENQTTKIVDKNGNPKNVYHYSDTDFNTFDMSKQKNKLGIYFTPSSKPNSKLRKFRITATLDMQNPLTISPENKASTIYSELKEYISDEYEDQYDTKFRELLIRDGYDGVIMLDDKGNVSQYVVLNPDQINVKNQGPIKQNVEEKVEQPKNVVTEKSKITERKKETKTNAKNKVTNPSKAKETGIFNENEVDKGKKSEGLNPDAMPLSDYREMQRLENGRYNSLGNALRHENLGTYMATKIATDLVGDYNEIIEDERDPDNLEDRWVSIQSDIEEMYEMYEDYLEKKAESPEEAKLALESADDLANNVIKGKTAKELIDQYNPDYQTDLKIYKRLLEKYPNFYNGKINLNGDYNKALREFAGLENETAQDIDYQEVAEAENETDQIPTIFEEDLQESNLRNLDENETAQTTEEEAPKNKVTAKKVEENKPKNLVTSESKVDKIIRESDGAEIKVTDDGDNKFITFNVNGKDYGYSVNNDQLKELFDRGAIKNADEYAERQAKRDEARNQVDREFGIETDRDKQLNEIFDTAEENLKKAKAVTKGAIGKVKERTVVLDNGTTVVYTSPIKSLGENSENVFVRVQPYGQATKNYVVSKIGDNIEIREGGRTLTDEEINKLYDVLNGKSGEEKVANMKVDVKDVENKNDPINTFLDNNEAIKKNPDLKYEYLNKLNEETRWEDAETGIKYTGTQAEKAQQLVDSMKLSNGVQMPVEFKKNNWGMEMTYGTWDTGLGSYMFYDDAVFEYAKFLYDNPDIRDNKTAKASGLKEAIKRGNEIHKEVVKDAEEQKDGTPLNPEKYIWQQPTADEGIEAVYEQVKKISDFFIDSEKYAHTATYEQLKELANLRQEAGRALWSKLQFKSSRSKLFNDFTNNVKEANGNEKQLRSIAKNLYIQKVKDDFKNNYNYPTAVTDKIKGLRTAKDNFERYLKGRNTSFSGEDPRIDYSEKDRIGAGVKRQDGNQITAAQRREIVNGVLEYAKYMGIDMKKMSEDAGVTYVHLNGKHPFLTSRAVGLFHGLFKSISIGADMESYKEKERGKGRDAKMETHTVPVVMAHEITHAIDSMFEWDLFSQMITDKMKYKMNNYRELGDYWRRKEEITARMVEEYVDVMKGGEGYYDTPGYWSKEVFDNEIKPYVEQVFSEKFDGYKLTDKERNEIKLDEAPSSKNSVTASDLNKVTNKVNAERVYSPTITVRLDENGNPLRNSKNKVTTKTNAEAIWNPILKQSLDAYDSENGLETFKSDVQKSSNDLGNLIKKAGFTPRIKKGNIIVRGFELLKQANYLKSTVDEQTAKEIKKSKNELAQKYIKAIDKGLFPGEITRTREKDKKGKLASVAGANFSLGTDGKMGKGGLHLPMGLKEVKRHKTDMKIIPKKEK